MTHKY